MDPKQERYINIEVDRLTNSIENSFTGEVFATSVVKLKISDGKLVESTEWVFDWLTELNDKSKEVYKLNYE